MLDILQLCLTVSLTVICVAGALWGIGKTLIQQAINDVATEFNEKVLNPNVKRAFSLMGEKSGEIRASAATRTKFAEALMDQMPAVKLILDKLGFDSSQAFELLRDPYVGPYIQQFIGNLAKSSQTSSNPQNNGGSV